MTQHIYYNSTLSPSFDQIGKCTANLPNQAIFYFILLFLKKRADKRQSKRNSKTGAWQSHGIMPEATTEIPSWKEWRLNGLSDCIFASWNSDKAVWLYFLLWHVKQLPMNIWKHRVWLKPLSAHFLSGQDAGNVWSLHPVEVSSVWPLNVLRFFF